MDGGGRHGEDGWACFGYLPGGEGLEVGAIGQGDFFDGAMDGRREVARGLEGEADPVGGLVKRGCGFEFPDGRGSLQQGLESVVVVAVELCAFGYPFVGEGVEARSVGTVDPHAALLSVAVNETKSVAIGHRQQEVNHHMIASNLSHRSYILAQGLAPVGRMDSLLATFDEIGGEAAVERPFGVGIEPRHCFPLRSPDETRIGLDKPVEQVAVMRRDVSNITLVFQPPFDLEAGDAGVYQTSKVCRQVEVFE